MTNVNQKSGMSRIQWAYLESEGDLQELKILSNAKLCLLFKYSSRCASSFLVLNRLEKDWQPEEMANVLPFFLNLIDFGSLSNQVSEDFNVRHESPQVLIIKSGKSVFDASHSWISYKMIREAIINSKFKSEK